MATESRNYKQRRSPPVGQGRDRIAELQATSLPTCRDRGWMMWKGGGLVPVPPRAGAIRLPHEITDETGCDEDRHKAPTLPLIHPLSLQNCVLRFLLLPYLPFPRHLLPILILHPAQEENAHDDNKDNIARHPHDEAAKLLIGSSGDAPDTRRGNVRRVQRGREGEARAKQDNGHTAQKEVQDLSADGEARQILRWAEDGPPVQQPEDDKGQMLKDMDILVFQRGIIQRRGVPEEEIGVKYHEGDSRKSQKAQDGKKRPAACDGTNKPFRRADQQQWRPHNGQEEMLHHVRAKQIGIAQFIQRRNKRQEHQPHTQHEGNYLPLTSRFKTMPFAQWPDGIQVQSHNQRRADHDAGVPVPPRKPEIQSYIRHDADFPET